MVESFGYPYVPDIHEGYGIPLKDVPLGFNDTVIGGSGRELIVRIHDTLIFVSDREDPWFMMEALVDDTILELTLQTRKPDTNQVHPDFWAAKFINFAIRHFEANGVEIQGFEAVWLNNPDDQSTNYRQFREYLTANERTKKKEQEAARQTWTGRVMAKHGFTNIENIKREEGEGGKPVVVVLFSRPEVNSTA